MTDIKVLWLPNTGTRQVTVECSYDEGPLAALAILETMGVENVTMSEYVDPRSNVTPERMALNSLTHWRDKHYPAESEEDKKLKQFRWKAYGTPLDQVITEDDREAYQRVRRGFDKGEY